MAAGTLEGLLMNPGKRRDGVGVDVERRWTLPRRGPGTAGSRPGRDRCLIHAGTACLDGNHRLLRGTKKPERPGVSLDPFSGRFRVSQEENVPAKKLPDSRRQSRSVLRSRRRPPCWIGLLKETAIRMPPDQSELGGGASALTSRPVASIPAFPRTSPGKSRLLSRPTAASWEENRLSPRKIPTSGRHVSACGDTGDRRYASREPHSPVSGGKPGNPGRFRAIRPPAPHRRRGGTDGRAASAVPGLVDWWSGAVAPPPCAPVFSCFLKSSALVVDQWKRPRSAPTRTGIILERPSTVPTCLGPSISWWPLPTAPFPEWNI